jgi:hypothetical protein
MVTVDRVGQGPSGPDEDRSGDFAHGGWRASSVDPDIEHLMFVQTSTMDALVPGRRTDEMFVARCQLEHRPDQGE